MRTMIGCALYTIYHVIDTMCCVGEGEIFNFMLEEVHDYGPTNVAKFGR